MHLHLDTWGVMEGKAREGQGGGRGGDGRRGGGSEKEERGRRRPICTWTPVEWLR
jgi:hypothetical protein